MKIAHIVPSMEVNRGGPTRSIASMIKAQTDLGADVRLIFGERCRDVTPVLESVNYWAASLIKAPFAIPSWGLVRLITTNIAWADVVHLHSVWNGVISLAEFHGRRQHKRIVLSPRGMLDERNVQRRRGLKAVWLRFVERNNLAAIGGLHFQDESELRGCKWLAVIQDKPFIIQPNGFEMPSALLGINDNDPKRGDTPISLTFKAGEEINLVFLGRLNVIKGLELQVQLIADLIDAGIPSRLHLVGPDDGVEAQLRALAANLGVAEFINFVGPIYGENRFAWLQQADAVLLTSHYECNSNTAMEALGVGAVLVATDSCHLDRPASAGAVCVVARDRTALLSAVLELVKTPDRAVALRKRAADYARQNLDWTVHASDMLKFYEQLLAQPL